MSYSEGKWQPDNQQHVTTKIMECIDQQLEGVSSEVWEKMPPSVGWMFYQPCNFSCNYCFARFDDLEGFVKFDSVLLTPPGQYLNKEDNLRLTSMLSDKFSKVTLLGGEPTLVPYLPEMLKIAKDKGCTTAIITNGYRLQEEYVRSLAGLLDWVTISIDSANPETHSKLGRGFKNGEKPLTNDFYLAAANLCRKYGMKFKISTVVNSLNKDEDMSEFVLALKPDRWKIFQCLYIDGENNGRVDDLLITKDQLQTFFKRHEKLVDAGIKMYASTEDTKNGYACITPAGCFLDDIENKHRYSRPILQVGVDEAWKDIDYKPENFKNRGGLYDWKTDTAENAQVDMEDLMKQNLSRVQGKLDRKPVVNNTKTEVGVTTKEQQIEQQDGARLLSRLLLLSLLVLFFLS